VRPCEEMKKLRNYLDRKEIPWTDRSDTGICRTRFEIGKYEFSVIHGRSTYGGIDGLLELAIFDENHVIVNGDSEGWLSAKDVICKIKGVQKECLKKEKDS
jgi:hypothetical protein